MDKSNIIPPDSIYIHSFACGATSGAISSFLTAPTQTVNKYVNFDQHFREKGINNDQKFKGVVDCFRKLRKQYGFRYFYLVQGVFCPRLVFVAALSFSLKEFFKTKKLKERSFTMVERYLVNFYAGGAAGIVAEFISYPLKSMESKYLKMKKMGFLRASSFDDFQNFVRSAYKKGGMSAFYNGFTLSCLHQSLYRALYFGIYDSLRLYLIPQKNYEFLVCFPSGYIAAFLSSTICFPMHRVALRMAQEQQKGIGKFVNLYFNNQLHHFFKGWRINLLGAVRGAFVLTFNDGISYYSRKKYLFH